MALFRLNSGFLDPDLVKALEEDGRKWQREHDAKMRARYGENPPFQPYRPSNGSEGDHFDAEFCDRCTHDAAYRAWMDEYHSTKPCDAPPEPEPCAILTSGLAFDIEEEHYPGESWVYFNGKPVCMAFREKGNDGDGETHPVEPDPSQLDMFVPLPVLEAVPA